MLTSYFSQIFGASHCSLMYANWDMLHPNCEWSSRDIEGPFNEEIRMAVYGLSAENGPGWIPYYIFSKVLGYCQAGCSLFV